MPLLVQNLHILTKPNITYSDEQRAITLEGMVWFTIIKLEEEIIVLTRKTITCVTCYKRRC